MSLQTLKSYCRQALQYRYVPSDIPILLRNVLILLLAGRLFYGSFVISLFILPLSIPWFFHEKKKKERKDNHDLGIQFKDAMMAVSTAQKAGYSVENSFHEAKHDMELLYGKHAPICKELEIIHQGINNNLSVEKMIRKLGRKSGNRDIAEFAGVFAVAKRSGGNMTETIERCVDVIGKRMEVESEIDVLISAKRMEAQIMEMVPFGIMAYVGLTNPGFFDALYGNVLGIFIMTVCLLIYIAAYLMIEKIVTIEI